MLSREPQSEREATISQRSEWLRQLPAFFNLTQVQCREIVAAAHEKGFLRRQTLFTEDAACRRVLLLLSGCVKTTQLGPTGCEGILRLSGPGEPVGAFETYLGSNS
jgi:CRP-like cAMP-binding protein